MGAYSRLKQLTFFFTCGLYFPGLEYKLSASHSRSLVGGKSIYRSA